jgi:hypothetical protein
VTRDRRIRIWMWTSFLDFKALLCHSN